MFDRLKRLFTGGPPARQTMGYAPLVLSADKADTFDVDGREAVLLTNVQAAGSIQYAHILAVYETDGEPCLFVAAEVNAHQEAFGGGSHFLGVFPGDGHLNLGTSNDWADLTLFAEKAVAVARQHLKDR
jgi:hypothetical protein